MLRSWFSPFLMLFTNRRQSKPKRAIFVLKTMIFVAFFGHWLANEPSKTLIPPLIPYSSGKLDNKENASVSPFATQNAPSVYYRHWLGTDALGRDVSAGIITGTRTAFLIGVGGVFLALLIGLPIGLAVGYFGDNRLEVPIFSLILRGCFFVLTLFYLFVLFNVQASVISILGVLIVAFLVFEWFISILEKSIFLKFKKITLPLDLVVMRFVEVMQSIPFILWVLGALTIVQRLSTLSLILFIGATGWTGFVRLIRGEMIRIRQLEYMEAAEVMGARPLRIILHHALPNILTPVLIAFAFGIANGVLLEASLSFLGLGLPVEQVTWGTLLMEVRTDYSAWWMAVFPGLAVFATVYTFNRLGEYLSE
ncbi:MAG: ABC transporter permease [Saprospiraceae bacterium]|nr:ABC transporter permease [Saprospiraceae bacterium]